MRGHYWRPWPRSARSKLLRRTVTFQSRMEAMIFEARPRLKPGYQISLGSLRPSSQFTQQALWQVRDYDESSLPISFFAVADAPTRLRALLGARFMSTSMEKSTVVDPHDLSSITRYST